MVNRNWLLSCCVESGACRDTPPRPRSAVLDWARLPGYERVWATVWEWNIASRRLLAEVGFTEERKELDAVCGNNLFTTRRL